MNQTWRKYLRNKRIASITIHRSPPSRLIYPLQPSTLTAPPGVTTPRTGGILAPQRPYFHILFKPQYAEPWMRSIDSRIPSGWLAERGFGNMEFFQVKVGRWMPGHYLESSRLV